MLRPDWTPCVKDTWTTWLQGMWMWSLCLQSERRSSCNIYSTSYPKLMAKSKSMWIATLLTKYEITKSTSTPFPQSFNAKDDDTTDIIDEPSKSHGEADNQRSEASVQRPLITHADASFNIYSDNRSHSGVLVEVFGGPVMKPLTLRSGFKIYWRNLVSWLRNLKQSITRGDIVLEKVPTEEMKADILTKNITGSPFHHLMDKIVKHLE